jgi:hypothetical protein
MFLICGNLDGALLGSRCGDKFSVDGHSTTDFFHIICRHKIEAQSYTKHVNFDKAFINEIT